MIQRMTIPQFRHDHGTGRNGEHEIQSAYFGILALPHIEKLHPVIPYIFAVPNASGVGGKHGAILGRRFKLEGVKPGVPDIVIPVPAKGFHGAYLEAKTVKGSTSPDQKKYIEFLKAQGYYVEVCKGLGALIKATCFYLDIHIEIF